MAIKFLPLVSCLFWGGSCLAQAQDDHLVPASSYFFSYAHEQAYYPKVRETLAAGLSDAPLARVVVLPSLTTEYLLTLEREKQQVYLLYRTCQPSVWSTLQQKWNAPPPKASPQPTVATRKVEVSPELTTAITALFTAAIARTKYPEPRMTMRADGTTFVFSTFRAGIGGQGGETWSPAAGTRMAELVAVVSQLQKLATTAAAERQPLAADIIAQATRLTDLLKAY